MSRFVFKSVVFTILNDCLLQLYFDHFDKKKKVTPSQTNIDQVIFIMRVGQYDTILSNCVTTENRKIHVVIKVTFNLYMSLVNVQVYGGYEGNEGPGVRDVCAGSR